MKSLKAIVLGSLFIIVVGLMIQLAYIFLAVGYANLAKSYPFLNAISGYIRYLLGIPLFFLLMFLGGYITADIAQKKVLLHCALVAVLTVGLMMASALANMELTLSGMFVFALALVATLAGGIYWQRTYRVTSG